MKKAKKRASAARKLKKSRSSKVAIAALSEQTGIVHVFSDLREAERLATKFKKARDAKLHTDLVNSIAFWNWINAHPPLLTQPDFQWSAPVFRMTSGWSPLSIIGSISDGGRFNVGGAQICPEFFNVKKAGALYAASTLACCYLEMSGNPTGKPDEYELTPKKTFKFWDLAKVLTELNNPALDDLVKAAPLEAIWGYQKVPLISQLLAHHLRELGGDGIAFPSTKDQKAINLCFFFKTDEEASNDFSVRKLN
jgi:hypothetical protein